MSPGVSTGSAAARCSPPSPTRGNRPMRLATVIACTLWVTMVGIMPGFAEKRVALVLAAKAGSTANDGNGEHRPFAAALLKHLAARGLGVRLALGEVRAALAA